jgi:hypothetical protein
MNMKTESKHTSGPWTHINDLHPEIIGHICGSTYDPVCEVLPLGNLHAETRERREANARLIAAAPDMLKALERIVKLYNFVELKNRDPEAYEVITSARALLWTLETYTPASARLAKLEEK